MPEDVVFKRLGATQDSVEIKYRSDIAQRCGAAAKAGRRDGFRERSEDNVACALELVREVMVGGDRGAIKERHAGMIRPQIREQNVERNGFRTLRRELLHDAAIDVARPVEPVDVTKPTVFYALDRLVVDENETEIRRTGIRAVGRPLHAPVVGHPFEPAGKQEVLITVGQR